MIYHDENGEEYELVAQEKRPDGNLIIKPHHGHKHASHKQVMSGVMYYLKWSTEYMKAARAGDSAKMKELEDGWNPERVIHEAR